MNKISIPWHKVFVDVFILVFLCALLFIFKYQLDTHKSGFFCNDFSVNMVFKNSTVPNILLFIISFVLPSLFIVGTEICRGVYVKIKPAGARHNRHSTNVSNKYHLQLTSTREVVLSEPVGNIIINFMYFSLGHLCNSIVTLIGKKTIGRLRPNFLDVCKPEKNPYMTYCNTQLTGKTYLLPDIDFKCLTSDINPKEVNLLILLFKKVFFIELKRSFTLIYFWISLENVKSSDFTIYKSDIEFSFLQFMKTIKS